MKIIDVQLPKAKALFVESVKLKQWKEMSIVILDSDRQWYGYTITIVSKVSHFTHKISSRCAIQSKLAPDNISAM